MQLRRPAIQKQFYDIEERVLIRPAGSALVELDEPTSRTQKGAAVISPLATIPAFAHYPAHYPQFTAPQFAAPVFAAPTYPAPQQPAYPGPQQPAYPQQPQYPQQPEYPTEQQQQQPEAAPAVEAPSAPAVEAPSAPTQDGSNSFTQQQQGVSSFAPQQDLESISVDNPEFGARSANPEPDTTDAPVTETIPAATPASTEAPAAPAAPAEPSREQYEAEIRAMFEARRFQFESEQRAQAEQRAMLAFQQNTLQRQQYERAQADARAAVSTEAPAPTEAVPVATTTPAAATEAPAAPTQAAPENNEQVAPEARSFLGRQEQQIQQTESLFQQQALPEARSVVPSVRNLNPEVNKANQQRLIELLTARGGVAEVQGYGSAAGRTNGHVGDAGNVRARVLSATPAPEDTKPTGERVSTRRIVVSRPIETVQEIEVVEPATKIHRVTVQQPTLIKTARLGVARVPTTVPVYGKSLHAHPIAYY